METWWDMGSWFCLCEMGVSNHRGVVLQWADSLKSKISFCRGVCHGWRTDLVSNVLIFIACCNIHCFLWSYPHLFGCTVRTQAVKNQLHFCCSTAAVALMPILLATLNHRNNSPSSCMMLRLATTDGPKFELGWPWLGLSNRAFLFHTAGYITSSVGSIPNSEFRNSHEPWKLPYPIPF